MLFPRAGWIKFRRMKTTCQIRPVTGRLFLLAAFLSTLRVFAADQTDQWKVQVTGLRVVAPPPAGDKDNARGAFFSPPGVAVALTLTPASGSIVSINQFDSTVDAFTDDKGTDLLAVKSEDPFNKPGFGSMDSKGTNATVEVQAAGLPARGAAALNISGKIAAQIATGSKPITVDNVEINTNASFNLGDLPVKISAAGFGKAMFSDKNEFSVTFSSTQDLAAISTVDFYDAQGNKIGAHKSSWGGGMGDYMCEFTLEKKLDRGKIVATCWQGLQAVEVPVSVKTGLGL